MKTRQEIAPEDQWDTASLFPNFEAWQKAFDEIDWSPLKSFKDSLSEGPFQVKKTLEKLFEVERELVKLYVYAHLRHDERLFRRISRRLFHQFQTLLEYLVLVADPAMKRKLAQGDPKRHLRQRPIGIQGSRCLKVIPGAK